MAKSKNATKAKAKAAVTAKVATKKTPVKIKAAKVVKAKSAKKLKSTKPVKTLKAISKIKKVTAKAAKTNSVKKSVSVKPAAKKSVTVKTLAPNKNINEKKSAKLSAANKKTVVAQSKKGLLAKTTTSKSQQAVQVQKSLTQAKPAKLTVTNLKMTPLDDRLLVEVDATEKKTAGGLYIPDTAQVTGNHQGKVLAVGRGHMNKKGKTKPMDVKVGDVILFSEYAGEKYSESNKDIRIIREADVLGVVSNEK